MVRDTARERSLCESSGQRTNLGTKRLPKLTISSYSEMSANNISGAHPSDEKLTLSRNTRRLSRAGHDLRREYVRFAVVLRTYLPSYVPPQQVFLVRGTYVRYQWRSEL